MKIFQISRGRITQETLSANKSSSNTNRHLLLHNPFKKQKKILVRDIRNRKFWIFLRVVSLESSYDKVHEKYGTYASESNRLRNKTCFFREVMQKEIPKIRNSVHSCTSCIVKPFFVLIFYILKRIIRNTMFHKT